MSQADPQDAPGAQPGAEPGFQVAARPPKNLSSGPVLRSRALVDGHARAPARAMLKAAGFTGADLAKPLIAIANTWTEIGPCNLHLKELAECVKQGIREAGGTPMEFNTVSVSDCIPMGTPGMATSLISRDLIPNCIEP